MTATALLLAGCARVDPPAPSGPAPRADSPASCYDARTVAVVRLTNEERAQRGLPALEPDPRLQRAAKRHAEDMARGDFMAHQGSDGSTPAVRVQAAGYPWTDVAENVAAGYADPASVHRGWMASPAHRENVLLPSVRHMGVGYAYRADTPLHTYWVTVFGDTEAADVPTPTC